MVNSKKKIGIILQARVGSTRLPSKVLKSMAGRPMIQWIIERLQGCRKADTLILATTTLKQDKPLIELAEKLNIDVFCGSELDVLDRYYQCALEYNLDHIIRATGDNPFVDTEGCDKLIDFYINNQLDYAFFSDEYPLGVGTEIFSFSTLQRTWLEGHAPHHREHVNEYIIENLSIFRNSSIAAPPEKSAHDLSLTVDTIEQFELADKIYNDFFEQHPSQLIPVEWAISYLSKGKSEY